MDNKHTIEQLQEHEKSLELALNITRKRIAEQESTTPKGSGVVDWDKDVWFLECDGNVAKLAKHEIDLGWGKQIAQNIISNSKTYLERLSRQRDVIQKLRECDGAVDEPVAATKNGWYYGVALDLEEGVAEINCYNGSSFPKMLFTCPFTNHTTAEAALEKLGAKYIYNEMMGV